MSTVLIVTVLLLSAAGLLFAARLVRRPKVSLVMMSQGDVMAYVRSRLPEEKLATQRFVSEFLTWHLDAPELGQDWGPWLDANFETLRDQAFTELNREHQAHAVRGDL